MPDTILKVESLTKMYGGLRAVAGVSFEVKEGEIVGLVGPNGAGKTTTIQMLLGLIRPSTGDILIFEKNMEKNREEILKDMNFVAPYAWLPANLTPHENLRFFSLLYDVPDAAKKIQEMFNIFHLTQFRRVRTGMLSSGEQTRLGLAKAFLNDPKLLLLDEPTSSLDPAIARELRGIIYERMRARGGAVLWTSHNMQEIATMCDKVLFLFHGRIIASGTPEELCGKFEKPNLEEVFIFLAKRSQEEHKHVLQH